MYIIIVKKLYHYYDILLMHISLIQIRYICKAIITICRARLRPHSMPLTEVEIDQKLTEHFATKVILTSREFRPCLHKYRLQCTAF